MRAWTIFFVAIVSAIYAYPRGDSQHNCMRTCLFDTSAKVCTKDDQGKFRMFENMCYLEKYNCANRKNLSKTDDKYCNHTDSYESKEQCSKIACPFIYLPICATNGQSFELLANACLIKIASCLRNEVWSFAHPSNCNYVYGPDS